MTPKTSAAKAWARLSKLARRYAIETLESIDEQLRTYPVKSVRTENATWAKACAVAANLLREAEAPKKGKK